MLVPVAPLKMPCARYLVAVVAFIILLSHAWAQTPSDAMRLFEGIVGTAMVESARAEWRKLPSDLAVCLNAALAREAGSIDQLALHGIGPNDARVAAYRAKCTSLLSRRLRQNVECQIDVLGSSITSYCDEAFARTDGRGGFQRLSIAEMVQSSGISQEPQLFEREDARARRAQMQGVNPNLTRVPAPNFDCSKAKTDSERTICNSFRLSLLDAEYGDLYRRASPFDKNGSVKNKVHEIWTRQNACAGAVTCIDDNLKYGLNYLAGFLRRNGETVETSIERARREQREAAERARREEQEASDRAAAEQRRLADETRARLEASAAERAKQEAERAKQEGERLQKETEQKVALEEARAEAQERAQALEIQKKREEEELEYRERVHETLAVAIPVLGCVLIGTIFLIAIRRRAKETTSGEEN
jgi:uncharacterized protein